MKNEVKDIEPRLLTQREVEWIREILQSNLGWKDTDISKTKVVAEGLCDDGRSIFLRAPAPENPSPSSPMGYIGRIVIWTDDGCFIEVRLDQSCGRLHELFMQFADPNNRRRKLPEQWTEVSHTAMSL